MPAKTKALDSHLRGNDGRTQKPAPTRLGDVANFRNGLNFTKDDRGAGCPYVGVPDFSTQGALDYSRLAQINAEETASHEDYLRNGDIVFVRSNGNKELVGRSIYIQSDLPALFSGFCIRARLHAERVWPLFVYYFSKSSGFRKQLSGTGGSNINNLNQTVLGDVMLPKPPLDEQQKIAGVLSALDAKIDLNNRINAELEALAKTLYDYWFVQFDFPWDFTHQRFDPNGRPYKTSGGKMVWNPTLKREIPAGWQASALSALVPISTNSINPGNAIDCLFSHLSIPGLDSTGSFIAELGGTIRSNKFTVSEHDLLVSKLNPWFNRVFADTAHADLICSTEFVIWRCATRKHQAYLHAIATHTRFIAYCTQSATGTSNSHKRVNPQVMMGYLVPYSESLAEKYGELAAPILEKRTKATLENRELTQLRDWLLPLLMNGQVRVA